MDIQAIETNYKGYRFRSRLEARWAIFFDALSMPYEYEKEGFNLGNAGWYLPDFYLPDTETWIEVKPSEPDETERCKVRTLACARDEYVDIVVGTPSIASVESSSSREILHCYPGSMPPGKQNWSTLIWCIRFWVNEAKANHPLLIEATIEAAHQARSARFEHGETPRVFNAWKRAEYAAYGVIDPTWEDVWEQARDILLESEKPDYPRRDFLDTDDDGEEP
jgi:hypothetical protein